jgi:hypothetical protein
VDLERIAISCKICDELIDWNESDGMFRTPQPFPICEDCLKKLKELIKEEK